eukprot:TRINITY_DN10970_c0_g1_i1.p3 TRINITY_DN10970_c0_g1~~TRINITY_DN10970_c0_g1_i1.p3  ORF type:complete len:114 (-),score=13.51 TRINITY_DN10970_c0_g1_i1:121-462(-)
MDLLFACGAWAQQLCYSSCGDSPCGTSLTTLLKALNVVVWTCFAFAVRLLILWCAGLCRYLYQRMHELVLLLVYGIKAVLAGLDLIFTILDSVPDCVGDMQKTVWVFDPLEVD